MVARLWPADAVGGAPSYTGRALRQTLSPLLGGATSGRPLGALSGIRPGIGIFVGVSSTVWYANAFSGVIDTEAAAISGPYAFAFDAQTSGAMTAAGGTARIDALAVRLNDGAEGDGTLVAPFVDIVYSVGTASPPAVPARSFVIAYLNVPATGGGVPTVTQIAPYAVAAGGIIPVQTLAARGLLGAVPGMTVYRIDTDTIETFDGGSWASFDSKWQAYSPTITGVSIGNGTLSARYFRTGKKVDVWIDFILGSTSAIGASIIINYPFTAVSVAGNPQVGVSNSNSSIGNSPLVPLQTSTTQVTLFAQNATATYLSIAAISGAVPGSWAAGNGFNWRGQIDLP